LKRLTLARVCLVVTGGLYLIGGLAAVTGFFQMRAGPADLAAWFSSNGMPSSRFLVIGIVYSVVGVAGICAAMLLRKTTSRGRLLASAFITLVTLDIVAALYRKGITGFGSDDIVETFLTASLLLVAAVCLIQRRNSADHPGAA
jgi:hypothetical protein